MNTRSSQAINARFLFKPEMVRIPRWKRAIDLAFCLLALPILGLVALVMAGIVKVCAPGPLLFKQERVGYRGSRFMCYKFRTMVVGADTRGHQAYYQTLLRSQASMVKLDAKGDARLIPGAWLLRAAGLDELPQILNILKREMSVVGPRPCLPYEFEGYEAWQRERFSSVPGLTGLWQVSGKNRTSFEEMIRLDIRYAAERSLPVDLRIMLMTPVALAVQLADTRRSRNSPAQVMGGGVSGRRLPRPVNCVGKEQTASV